MFVYIEQFCDYHFYCRNICKPNSGIQILSHIIIFNTILLKWPDLYSPHLYTCRYSNIVRRNKILIMMLETEIISCLTSLWRFYLVIIQGSKFIFGFGSTCATRCKFLGAQLQILYLAHPLQKKLYFTHQKERLSLRVAIWAYSSSIEHNENKIKESGYFTQEFSLDNLLLQSLRWVSSLSNCLLFVSSLTEFCPILFTKILEFFQHVVIREN